MRIVLLFCFLSTVSYSQTWQWVEQTGTSNPDNGRAICTDNSGNCYVAGNLNSQATIFKYNSLGSPIWNFPVWYFGAANAIVSDNAGYLYVVGDTSSPSQIKIAKCDTAGNIIWKIDGGIGNGNGISIDNAGFLYVTGQGNFLTKYDTSGNFIWNRITNATGNSLSLDLAGNIYITGLISDTTVFGLESLIPKGSGDIFIAKYDSAGICIWAKRAGGNYSAAGYSKDCGYAITVDGLGNSYITGSFLDTADFDSFTVFGSGSNDIFIAKYNAAGNALWVKVAQGLIDEEGRCIALDNVGNVLIGGSYVPNTNFEGLILTGWGNYDAFVAKYDTSGNFINIINAGGSSWNEFVYGLSIDNLGNIYATGSFTSMSQFGAYTLFSNGLFDIFTGKINFITGVEENAGNTFNTIIYPNPSSNQINIEFELSQQEIVSIEIKNVLGQLVYSSQTNSSTGKQSIHLDVSNFSNGVYFVQLKNEKTLSNKKFVKQ